MDHKKLVYASRTMLVMLVVAAAAVLGLGLATVLLMDPPEVSGWLRTVFGTVFAVVAVSMAAVLGIPSGVGLWAMAGSNTEGAVPALPEVPRRILAVVAVGTVIVTAVVLLVTGSAVTLLNLGLLGLVALGALGLAGAVAFSPHRWRAISSAVALVAVALGTAWVLRVFLATPA